MSTNLDILLWSKAWQVKVGKIYKCDVIQFAGTWCNPAAGE